MSKSFAAPHLSLPGVRDTRIRYLGPEAFGLGDGSYEFTATADKPLVALVNFDDIAPTSDMKFRVVWSTSNTTTTNSATFRVRLAKIALGTTASDGKSLTALDTTITAANPTATADVVQQTAAGTKQGGILADSTDLLKIAVDVSAVSGLTLGKTSGDRVVFYGVLVEYTRNAL